MFSTLFNDEDSLSRESLGKGSAGSMVPNQIVNKTSNCHITPFPYTANLLKTNIQKREQSPQIRV